MDEVKVKINEIYYTFSGEGKTAGMPVVIVRMTGCNLRCSYCDSQYSYEEGEELTFDEVVKRIKKYNCNRVLLTGGEPLVNSLCLDLVERLKVEHFFIILETNGSLSIEKFLLHIDMFCIDIKCPSSGMTELIYWENLECIGRTGDEIKFVIGDRKDYEFAKGIVKKYNHCIDNEQFVFSPVWGKIEPKQLAEWMLEDKLDVKYSLQMHKVIWNKDKRGV